MPCAAKGYTSKFWRYALVVLVGLADGVSAQRHPESQGPLPYYRDAPGVLAEPEWLHRPEFIRGPRDRYERGANRLFLATGDDVPYLNYAEERFYSCSARVDSLVPTQGASLEISQYTLGSHG